ncbi:hypothetical protein [Halosimplex sp. J119]
MSNHQEPLSDIECKEEALGGIRDAIAAVQRIPAPALNGEKHDQLLESADTLQSLERALTNEVDQLRDEEVSDG